MVLGYLSSIRRGAFLTTLIHPVSISVHMRHLYDKSMGQGMISCYSRSPGLEAGRLVDYVAVALRFNLCMSSYQQHSNDPSPCATGVSHHPLHLCVRACSYPCFKAIVIWPLVDGNPQCRHMTAISRLKTPFDETLETPGVTCQAVSSHMGRVLHELPWWLCTY
jgi:hypothetical protein